MNTNATTILLTTLAEYQTKFWIDVCQSLKESGHSVAVLSFDDRSCEWMDCAGITNFNIPTAARSTFQKLSVDDLKDLFQQYNIDNINLLESHERMAFKIHDKNLLDQKFASYLIAVDSALSQLDKETNNLILIQELGGFISVLASFFAARKRSIDNYFLEPAFFKGRLFALKNTFCAPFIKPVLTKKISIELRDYIHQAVNNQSIVIPDKDRHHYNKAINKVFNITNVKRLSQKLIDQYVYKKHQEFGYNWVYVGFHLKMLMNSWRLKNNYSSLSDCEHFVYFPFHVPNDVAITLRSPEYLDQLALVEFLARAVPHEMNVVIKEHPAMIGALGADRLSTMLNKYDNLNLVAPSTNNYDVIIKSRAVVTINSKSGAEAAMLGKPVFVLGNAFYENSPLVDRIESVKMLPEAISCPLRGAKKDANEIESYFQTVWNHTWIGELYVNDPKNIKAIVSTLIKIVDA